MRFLTRTVLTWLLALAIPLQGFAASAMLFCAPAHSGMVAVTQHQPTHQHEHASAPSHHAPQTATASLSHADDVTPSQAPTAKVGQVGDGKCSTCATCCTGSVLVSTLSAQPSVAVTGSISIPFTTELFASHVPEGSAPPPRSNIA